jgi:RNA polymerase sigma factor (sigma-70 family)
MRGTPADPFFRHVRRVFNLGAVGTVPDAQLLDWFVSARDDSAEAAFEELMIRHGPMVFGICNRVLQDVHDAQDAFQAVFLVLANRARSIRRRDSVASWLFGVAQRVAARARSRAARRRAIDQKVAERATDCYVSPEHDSDRETVHEELDRLPERLKAPVVLCYLEGLSYDAAAHQLDLSEGALRGRLSQARKRLRSRLAQRGVRVPAGLLAAGASTEAQAAIPEALIRSTIQIAHGLTSGNGAVLLAKGVLNSMLVSQLKIAAGIMLITAASCLTAGIAWALAPRPGIQPKVAAAQADASPTKTADGTTRPNNKEMNVRGIVVDEAGRPVAGINVQAGAYTNRESHSVTNADGWFAIPIRRTQSGGMALLARSRSVDRAGVFQYGWELTGAQATAPARIVLKPTRQIQIRVADSSNSPVAAASIQAAGQFCVYADALSRDDGLAWLRIPVDAKIEWIFALKSGRGFDYAEYGPIDEAGRTQGGSPVRDLPASVSLMLDAPRTARIKAVDRGGNPVPGVAFAPWLLHKEGRRSALNISTRIKEVTTGPDGVATFDWLPADKDDATFWPVSGGYAYRRVQLNLSEAATATTVLTRTEMIRGRVSFSDGRPASGIKVQAYGTGQGMDNGQARVLTAEDGSYEMSVNPVEAYAVYVDDQDWAAPSRLDVVVREGKPVEGVDFTLSRGTIIRGTVTVGAANRPVSEQFIRLDEAGDRAPEEIREPGDRVWRQVRRQFGAMTDSKGQYAVRVGPGTYTLMGPPRTSNEKITVTDQTELVRNFRMPRPEKGMLTGRVVLSGKESTGVGGARIEIVAANPMPEPISVTADSDGQFRAERQLDPLVIFAATPDRKLGALVTLGAENTEVVIPVAPMATATGMLIDEKKRPVANTPLHWGRRVYLDEERGLNMTCFGSKVVTDSEGRFTLPALVVGQEYEIGIQRDNTFPEAGAVCPKIAEPIDLGILQLGTYQSKSPDDPDAMSSFTKAAPGPGAVAPSIEATTLEGKPITLADFKGMHVLLDFWATWCGPCIAEIPQLQSVHEAFGKDQKFAILSLSVDEGIDEPRKFQEKRKLPWMQAFLGAGIQGPTPAKFGVRAIPAFVLVGPDGKIVARGMRGDDIKKEVAKALQSQALPLK